MTTCYFLTKVRFLTYQINQNRINEKITLFNRIHLLATHTEFL